MTGTVNSRETARGYLRRGWAPIPVPYKKKKPGYDGWQKLRLVEPDLDDAFPNDPMNVSVLPGPASGGLADVDLDVPQAVLLADAFLPPTRAEFGRTSARRAHRLYGIVGPAKSATFEDPTVERRDPERGMLVEFRFSGHTLFPGSTHPSGEAITWDKDGEPATVTAEELLPRIGRLASAVLLARHWPGEGTRHKAALALAGGLLRAGWTEDEAVRFLAAVVFAVGDDEPEDRIRAAVSSAEAREEGRPTTGWTRLSSLIDPRVVTAVVRWLGTTSKEGQANSNSNSSYEEFASSSERPDPERVARSIPVPAFPLEVFPPRVRAYLERGAAAVGCPPDLVALPFLGYAASAVGRSRTIRIKPGWVQRAAFWAGVVAASGDGKSPADGHARAALDELQAEADGRYQDQFAVFKRELARWKAGDPKARGEEPPPPLYEHWYTTDATVESLAPILHGNPGLALACDELVAWARGLNAYKKGGNDRQKMLEIWNGRPLKVDRKTQGVIFVKDPVLCVVGGIQPERLHELTREASAHDGLLPRFCWCYPDVDPADWSWDGRESRDLDRIVALFRNLRGRAAPCSSLVYAPDPEAKAEWKAWYDETMRGRKHLPPLAREFASKLPAQLARLWLVLAAIWEPDATDGVASVERLRDAIAVVEYDRAHARRVLVHFGTQAPPAEAGLASRVRAILARAVGEHAERGGWIGRTEIWAALSRNCSAEALDAALRSLEARWIAESREVSAGTNKRSEWRLVLGARSADPLGEAGVWEDEEGATEKHEENSSYEEFDRERRRTDEGQRCRACGTANRAADGVCLTCHPREERR